MGLREFGPTLVPSNWRDTIYPDFETQALEIISVACIRLQTDSRRPSNWEERHYSWALVRHLEDICLKRNLPFSPRYDPIELSDQEFAAGESPKSSPVLDICVRWRHNIPEIRFAVEAKILVTRTVGNYRPRRTVEEYVSEGVCRFLSGKYAREMPSGVMLGYVLVGRTSELVDSLNDALKQQQVPCEEPLREFSDGERQLPRYVSSHLRDRTDIVVLHHLFIEFAPGDE